MALNLPNVPVDGQQSGGYVWSASLGAWKKTPDVASGLPAGSIMSWAGTTLPANWLACNGAAVSRTGYPSLFAAIGTTYGVGDGSTTFNLPNFPMPVEVLGKANKTAASSSQLLTTSYVDVAGVSVTAYSDGSTVDLDFTAYLQNAGSGADRVVNIQILCDGVVVDAVFDNHRIPLAGGGDARYFASAHVQHTPAAGTHTWKMQALCTSSSSVSVRSAYLGVTQRNTNTQKIIKTSAGVTAGDSELATRVVSLESSRTDYGWTPAIPGSISSLGATASLNSTTGVVTVPPGVTLIRLDNLFQVGYEYEITLDFSVKSGHATDNSAWMRMREGGVANSTAGYQTAGAWAQYNATWGVYSVNGGTVGAAGAVSGAATYVDFTSTIRLRPMSINGTGNKAWFYSFESFTSGSARGVRAGGYTPTPTTEFDGIEFWGNSAQTGLMQGRIRVFKRKVQ